MREASHPATETSQLWETPRIAALHTGSETTSASGYLQAHDEERWGTWSSNWEMFLQARLRPAQSPVRRDFTGSRGELSFPVLKQQWLAEPSQTRLTSWISNEKRGSSKCTVLQTLGMPTPKQGNVKLDLNVCFIFRVSDFTGLLKRPFLMFFSLTNHRSSLAIISAPTYFLVCLHLSNLPGTRIGSFLLRYNTTKVKAILALTFATLTHPDGKKADWTLNFDKITSNSGHQTSRQ